MSQPGPMTKHPKSRSLPLMATLVALFLIPGCQPGLRRAGGDGAGIRAIWVTRWDYKSADDIRTIMENCRRAEFNTVFFQVRGNGTAFYRSKLEPWADELGGSDPGFDPLAVACRQAHRRGLKLHAWVNVMPAWRGKNPPNNPKQLYHARSDWFWRDSRGRRQPLGWYNSLNPCYPEVRRYLVAVMHEIVKNYRVDGLHLDYIRFPNEWTESYGQSGAVPDYPRDPKTLALYKRDTGHTPESSPSRWTAWRAAQVTHLLRDIRRMVDKTKPGVQLSAAVGSEPEESYRRHFQDSLRWIREGLLDAVVPMNYARDMRLFSRRVASWAQEKDRVVVIMGIQFDKRAGRAVIEQIRRARTVGPHFAVFAYNSLFERLGDDRRPKMDEQSPARAALRDDAVPFLRFVAQRGS